MASDPNEFYNELKVHLESFRHREGFPKVPVTLTGIPCRGLTVTYQHPSAGPADTAKMANEAGRIIGAAGIGTAGGAAAGAIIGKVVLGGALARVGVASAGVAIGIPILAPAALVGAAIGTVAYAAYKIGRGKRDHERTENLLDRLVAHFQGFSPSGQWPDIGIFVFVRSVGLTATWQPEIKGEASNTAE